MPQISDTTQISSIIRSPCFFSKWAKICFNTRFQARTTSVCLRRPSCLPSSCVPQTCGQSHTHALTFMELLLLAYPCHPSTCFFLPGTILANRLENNKTYFLFLVFFWMFILQLDALAALDMTALDFPHAIVNIELTIALLSYNFFSLWWPSLNTGVQ